jgi:hypothetical protein
MIVITPDAHHAVTLDLHDYSAHRRANTAIAPLGSGLTLGHTQIPLTHFLLLSGPTVRDPPTGINQKN